VGKSHLAHAFACNSGARSLSSADLTSRPLSTGPAVIDDADALCQDEACAMGMFHLLESATLLSPVLLTGLESPQSWRCALPDLVSRLRAMPAFEIEGPDDPMLAAIAHKLFAACQLSVPDAVVESMIRTLERSPRAIAAFVTEIDRKALAESRTVTPALVRQMLAERGNGPS
jgi:chromosomal replication initiation ATPase DnaA